MSVSSLELALIAAKTADDKKGEDIVCLDLREQTDVCDYFLILSASNSVLLKTIADEIEEKLRVNCGLKPISSEGRANMTWVLIDYGSLVIHIFSPEARDFYRLERLWGDAPRVDIAQ